MKSGCSVFSTPASRARPIDDGAAAGAEHLDSRSTPSRLQFRLRAASAMQRRCLRRAAGPGRLDRVGPHAHEIGELPVLGLLQKNSRRSFTVLELPSAPTISRASVKTKRIASRTCKEVEGLLSGASNPPRRASLSF